MSNKKLSKVPIFTIKMEDSVSNTEKENLNYAIKHFIKLIINKE